MQKTAVFFSTHQLHKLATLIFFAALFYLFALFFWQKTTVFTAPDLSFVTLHGEKIALKSLRGKPVLLTFWATSCASCVKEIPDFITLYREFHPQGLEMIAVAMAYDPPNYVVEMSKAKQIPYPVVLDLDGDYARAFGDVAVTPSTFLINQSGKIIFSQSGLLDIFALQQRLQQLLQGKS